MKPKLSQNPENIRFEPVQKYKLQQIAEIEDRTIQGQVRRFAREKIMEWERKNGRIPVPARLIAGDQKIKGEKSRNL